jgi:hypothetical protein
MERLAKSASNSPGPTSSRATPWSPSTTASFFRPCRNPYQTGPAAQSDTKNDKLCTRKRHLQSGKNRAKLKDRDSSPRRDGPVRSPMRRPRQPPPARHAEKIFFSQQAGFQQTSCSKIRLCSDQSLTTDAESARRTTTARRGTLLEFRSIPGLDLANPGPGNALRFGRPARRTGLREISKHIHPIRLTCFATKLLRFPKTDTIRFKLIRFKK